MSNANQAPTHVVYLLHFAQPGEPLHYVGITTPPRLPARMREHAAGRGAIATTAACRAGLTWSLAATFETDQPELEKSLASLRSAKTWCPICRGAPPLSEHRPTKMAATSPWRPQAFSELLAIGSTQPGPETSMKKERRLRRPPPSLSSRQP